MKNNTLKKTLLFTVILLAVSLSVYAFAHGGRNYMKGFNGMGYGNHMDYDGHMGDSYGMNGFRGGHMWDSLSIDDQAKMQELFGNQNNRYNTGRGYGRCFN